MKKFGSLLMRPCCAHPCSQAAHLPLPFRKALFPKPSALPKALSKPAPRKFL